MFPVAAQLLDYLLEPLFCLEHCTFSLQIDPLVVIVHPSQSSPHGVMQNEGDTAKMVFSIIPRHHHFDHILTLVHELKNPLLLENMTCSMNNMVSGERHNIRSMIYHQCKTHVTQLTKSINVMDLGKLHFHHLIDHTFSTIKVLKFTGKESEWDHWSEKFTALARARGFAGILLGTEQAPNAEEDIDRKKNDGSCELTEAERKEKKRLRQANGNAYINLQLSCEELPYDLVSLAKTDELPDGYARDAWERLTSEYDLTEGEDKITLQSMFQQNQLEDVRTNITVWLTSMAIQVHKLRKLNHVLDEEYQITHILASLQREYSSVVEQVKIDRRTGSTLITMDEIKKRLKERYLQLKREHGWSEDEVALNMKSSNSQNKNIKKGSKGKYFKGRCNHCGKFGHKKADCWDLKNKKEKHQENEKKVQKDKSKVRCFKCGKLGHYANECKSDKDSSGDGKNDAFAMMCYEDTEDDKNGNGDDENKQESKNPEDYERKVGPGTPRNTEELQGTRLALSYVSNIFMTQVMNEWAMSTIEDNSATPRVPSLVRAWMESSKHGEDDKSRNMINIHLACEKSMIEHRSNNIPLTGFYLKVKS